MSVFRFQVLNPFVEFGFYFYPGDEIIAHSRPGPQARVTLLAFGQLVAVVAPEWSGQALEMNRIRFLGKEEESGQMKFNFS
jgi:peptidoglycan/LPS O-acetylase OafA/YrhL